MIHIKKFLNFADWLRAVQFFRNTVPKSEIQCKKRSAKSENNTKTQHLRVTKYGWRFSRFSNQCFILKLSIWHVTRAWT
jgi:hypothetical protein